MAQKSIVQIAREAWASHEPDARQAYSLFVRYCGDIPPPRVPGMDTVIRLAIRLRSGRTVQEAAAREYVYRWDLAPVSQVFGVPHSLGL
jgi:hypothetical protein